MIFRKRPKAQSISSLEELEQLMAGDKPILIDFWQTNCQPCRTMDGIVNELAEEYADGAHVVKVDVGRVPGAAQAFKIRSTPTFVLLGKSQKKRSKKARRQQQSSEERRHTPRWRASGLIRKDVMAKVLESNGGRRRNP